MKTDARSLFIFSVVLLAAVTAWRAVDIVRASREPAKDTTPADETPLELADFKPVGVLSFVKKQFSPETLIVPVNPFHPTFEEIIKSIIKRSDSNVIELVDANGNRVQAHFEGTRLVDANGNEVANPFQRELKKPGERPDQVQWQRPPAWQPVTQQPGERPAPPKPRVAFKGVMQRPDGQFAAYISDSMGPSRFVAVGDRVHNATVIAAGRNGVSLKLDDGTVANLTVASGPVTLENGGAQ